MRIVRPGQQDYASSRRISNARFDYRPQAIYYCQHAADVKAAIALAKEQKKRNPKLGVRVRSGGHQHEGMCSGNDVVIIDLSEMHNICFSNDLNSVRIEPGARLADVYEQTWARNRILPGGGCGDVRVGGLVQGAGWGPYSRALGFTCDRVLSFRIVMANGEEIEATGKNPPYQDLFWAVCGGGGGNFGVVTEFKFMLAELPGPIWEFTVSWDNRNLIQPVIEEWRKNFPYNKELNLTSFCRVSVANDYDKPVVVAGSFMGEKAPLEGLLQSMLPGTYRAGKAEFNQVHPVPGVAETQRIFHHPEYQPGPPPAMLRAASAEGPPKSTCDGGWYAHKVSSCFARTSFEENAAQSIADYLSRSAAEPLARRYVSLHSMGGAMGGTRQQWSCFPYRDRRFMLQYQAWWIRPEDPKEEKEMETRCCDWVKGFREAMQPYTEGAFINFPDRDLVQNWNTPEGRKKLLQYYYANNLDALIEFKAKYDPDNFFDFEMGIPTK